MSAEDHSQNEAVEKLKYGLSLAFYYADWISPEFKKEISGIKLTDLRVINQIYLCGCDGVPTEAVKTALEEENVFKALQAARESYLKKELESSYKTETSDLKEEHTVQPEYTIDVIKANLELLEREKKKQHQAVQPLITSEKVDPIIASEKVNPDKDAPNNNEAVIEYVNELMVSKKYNDEQVTYLLDLLESGESLKVIKAIASPNLPVNVMQRLKTIVEKNLKEGAD